MRAKTLPTEMRSGLNSSANASESAPDFLRRANPCVKLATLAVYIACVVSFGKYSFIAILPFLAVPAIGGTATGIGSREILRKTLPAIVIAAAAGAANPFIDSKTAFSIFEIGVPFGAVSLATLALKAYLCAASAVVFAKCTTPHETAEALSALKVPKAVVLQLLLTARYLGTLSEEASRMSRAYALRSPSHPKIRMRHFPHMLVSLLLRSADRADGIFAAMQNRSFADIPARNWNIRISELAAVAAFSAACIAARMLDIPQIIEKIATL